MAVQRLLRQNYLKIAVLGEGGVGKTSLCKTYNQQQTHIDTKQTIAVEFHVIRRIFGGINYMLQVWDLGGQKQFRDMGVFEKYCNGIQGAVVCFDLTDIETLFTIPKWLEFIPRSVPVVLVGTKADMARSDDFVFEEVQRLMENLPIVDFIETSALDYETVENVFNSLLSKIVNPPLRQVRMTGLLATRF